jgi:hypothetical protein
MAMGMGNGNGSGWDELGIIPIDAGTNGRCCMKSRKEQRVLLPLPDSVLTYITRSIPTVFQVLAAMSVSKSAQDGGLDIRFIVGLKLLLALFGGVASEEGHRCVRPWFSAQELDQGLC